MPASSVHFLLRLGALVVISICLVGCGRSESYRYKLTLAVNTPDGIKRSSSVTKWDFWEVSIPARGIPHRLRGEALYLDLGPSASPLIALLTSHLHEKRDGVVWDWSGGDLLTRLYGMPSTDFMDDVARLARMRGPRRITPADLPDLVTFADVNDPKSVVEVNSKDLQATLGQNVTWNEITLEMTDEPVTKGIELKLPWLNAYFQKNFRLDGTAYGTSNELANILSWNDLDQSGDLRREQLATSHRMACSWLTWPECLFR
jgi:hypothetical protein